MENTQSPANAKGSWSIREFLVIVGIPTLFVVAIVGTSGLFHGRTMFEKSLRGLAQPIGLIWLLLLTLTVACFVKRQKILGSLAMLLFALLGILGCETFSNWFCQRLEGPYRFVNPRTSDRFDVLVVLGGGTRSAGPDHVAFSIAGDRVGLAIRMHHAGKADKLLFTGENLPWETERLSMAEVSKRLATEMMVPESAIEFVPGQNTYAEFQYLKEKFGGDRQIRVGLLTSATHMPRAMRLASKVGLDVTPVPADFERHEVSPLPLSLIPSAGGYRVTERCWIEYLAHLVGR